VEEKTYMKFDLSSRIKDLKKLDWLVRDFLEIEIPQNIRSLHRLAKSFQKEFLGKDPKQTDIFEKELNAYGYINGHRIMFVIDNKHTKHEKRYVFNNGMELDPEKHDLSLFTRHPLEWKLKLLQGRYRFKFWNDFKKNLIRYRDKGYVNDEPALEEENRKGTLANFFDRWKPDTKFSFPMMFNDYENLDLSKEIIEIPTWRDDIAPRPDNLNYLISLIYGLPFSVFKKCECYDCDKWFVSHKKNKRFCNTAHQKKHNDWSLTNDDQKKSMYKAKRLKQSQRMAAKKK